MNVPNTIANCVDSLKQVRGISAIVLGGSRARGTASPTSDIDIGIYYDPAIGLDIAGLRRVASAIDDEHRDNLVTEIGGWGPWINGGGWLTVDRMPVDFLYRDLNQVSQVIADCVTGTITIDYQPGHPHGFVNAIYMAEIALCNVLWDPTGVVGELKGRTRPYPPGLQKATIGKFFWEATFAIDNGYKAIYKNDLAYVAGSCFRAVASLNQALFAMNESYLMNEKGAAAIADSFRIVPERYFQRTNAIFASISEDEGNLKTAIQMLRELIQETDALIQSKSYLNS
ncbi:nucleotidyltransferase domain-containing protein [Paenibacillus rhizovicinus]|uniref:Nucleotidyltransferase domain-containing protein n=1 Tax=Paenibacillus rhizovicinus TaxID=2704463 RepID=A0A6C0NUE7_9BACL|nr:nucleotidyltransferase domain-containing protein [Paenibacillus rhizovicinus]QHW29546.1 nucleotidyltransferase domain-containing protein [Paenibacillus rhizovicinus]